MSRRRRFALSGSARDRSPLSAPTRRDMMRRDVSELHQVRRLMITFESPQFRAQVETALDKIEKALRLDIESISDELIDPRRPDFEPQQYNDCVIGHQTELNIWLPRSDEAICSTYGELLALADELVGAELIGGVEGWTSRRLLLRVAPIFSGDYNIPLEQWLEQAGPEGVLRVETRVDDVRVTCAFRQSSVLFGLLVVAFGYYDKYFPPTYWDEYFVDVQAERPVGRSALRTLANAYIFELASSLRLDCRLDPRPDVIEVVEEGDTLASATPAPRLRPLLIGPGIDAAIDIYNSAFAAADASFQLLGFVKIIEHVSQTVVRTQITDAIRAKLSTPRALNPDANFVLELEALVAEQRTQRRDREALRATVLTCCDALELAYTAPKYLVRLASLKAGSDEKDRRTALEEFAGALTATRNWVAHAKAGYSPTGEECPPDHLSALAACARHAAEQCLRWYAARHESIRVI